MEKPYEQLRAGKFKVKNLNGTLRCPYCSGKKKQEFKFKDLMQHASGVGKGSANRSAQQKANHLSLAKYLTTDPADGYLTAQDVIEFNQDWNGFMNASNFEKSFQNTNHGKKVWNSTELKPSLNIYRWVARELKSYLCTCTYAFKCNTTLL